MTDNAPHRALTLDRKSFPHIMDLILSHPESWLPMRQTSRYYRKVCDERLLRHVILEVGQAGVLSVYPSVPLPIPWYRTWRPTEDLEGPSDSIGRGPNGSNVLGPKGDDNPRPFGHLLQRIKIIDAGDIWWNEKAGVLVKLVPELETLRWFGRVEGLGRIRNCLKDGTKVVWFYPRSHKVFVRECYRLLPGDVPTVLPTVLSKFVVNLGFHPEGSPVASLCSFFDAREIVYIFHQTVERATWCGEPWLGPFEELSRVAKYARYAFAFGDGPRSLTLVGFPAEVVDCDIAHLVDHNHDPEASKEDKIKANIAWHLRTVWPEDKVQLFLNVLEFLSHDQYRARVGDKLYDFETNAGTYWGSRGF